MAASVLFDDKVVAIDQACLCIYCSSLLVILVAVYFVLLLLKYPTYKTRGVGMIHDDALSSGADENRETRSGTDARNRLGLSRVGSSPTSVIVILVLQNIIFEQGL